MADSAGKVVWDSSAANPPAACANSGSDFVDAGGSFVSTWRWDQHECTASGCSQLQVSGGSYRAHGQWAMGTASSVEFTITS